MMATLKQVAVVASITRSSTVLCKCTEMKASPTAVALSFQAMESIQRRRRNQTAPSSRRSFFSSQIIFSSRSRDRHDNNKGTHPADPRIQVRPSNEKGDAAFESKFALPDKEKEQALGQLQTAVQDFYKNGQYTKALSTAETLLEDTTNHFGTNHPATASAHNNVGLMHKLLGHFDDSRKHYTDALKIYQGTVGKDHASYASSLHNLANLNRSQIHLDSGLRATDRLTLMEQAVEYLEQAYQIRLQERGPEHPHTVATRSSWGATLAAQILHHYKVLATSTTSNTKQRQYVSVLPDQEVTEQGWQASEEHLRQALDTAIQNPRGPSIMQERKKRKIRNKATVRGTNTTQAGSVSSCSSSSSGGAAAGVSKLQTLSAASAAQNLAIFLKARATTADTTTRSTMTTLGGNDASSTTVKQQEWFQEARQLYEQALQVRMRLQPADHPDLYVAKHNLAELLHAMGDEEAANALRQEIVDTYDPPSDESNNNNNKADGIDNASDEKPSG